MSARATFWAWRVGKSFCLNSTELLVLLRLADGASEETGECWYKQESIALATCLSRSGVQKALYSLEKEGLVRIERVTHEGRTLANTYRVNMDLEAPLPTTEAPVPQDGEGIPGKHGGASDVSSIDPASKTDPALRVDSAREARAASFEAGFEQFWAAYPRKVAKRGALKAWVAAAKSRRLPSLERVLHSIHSQGLKLGWFDGSCPADKIPHATTWLNQDRWNDELEIHPLPVTKPAPSPTDLAARDLFRSFADARAEILTKIAPNFDGWTGKSRTVFFDDLDACKSEAEVEAHLAACRALCDRLRAMGAFPLRRSAQPGEILPAGTGGPFIVSLADGAVIPTGAEFMGRPGGPSGDPVPVFFPRPISGCGAEMVEFDEGHACLVCERDFLADKEFEGRPALAPSGGDWWCCRADYPNHELSCPNSDVSVARRMEHEGLKGGLPYRDCNANPPAGTVEAAHSRLVEKGMLLPTLGADLSVKTSPDGPAMPVASLAGLHPDPRWSGWSEVVAPPRVGPGDHELRKAELQRAKVADGQHAYAHDALSGKCVWCDQPQDHIRHYLPRELPFNEQA